MCLNFADSCLSVYPTDGYIGVGLGVSSSFPIGSKCQRQALLASGMHELLQFPVDDVSVFLYK